MKQFFLDLLSGKENTPGSKRFTSLWGLVLFTIIVIFYLIAKCVVKDFTVQETIVWGTLTLILVPLGYNAAMGIKALTAKSQVASDIVKENAAPTNTQAAQEVLTNDKPQG